MQSRKRSLEETFVGTGLGLLVSTVLNHTFVPAVLHTSVSAGQNVELVAAFTVASLARGYFVRRYYNWRDARMAMRQRCVEKC